MALRDQPYLPLYVQDFLTDEKLSECSAATTGVYIRLMCLMHKSEQYGKILLKQKHKQNTEQIKNFASMVAKNMPYDLLTIERALTELVDEKVLSIDGDQLVQKRMVHDGDVSEKRAASGKKGGFKSHNGNDQANDFAIPKPQAKRVAKHQANSEYENAIENETVIETKKEFGKSENLLARSIEKTEVKVKTLKVVPDIPLPFSSDDFLKVWAVLIKEKKWACKSRNALAAAAHKLSKFDERTAIKMMLNTIEGNWQGLFEIKNNTNGKFNTINKSGSSTSLSDQIRSSRDGVIANTG